jgi:hypothetical protein
MSKRAGIVSAAVVAALGVVALGTVVLDGGVTTTTPRTTSEVPTSAPPVHNVPVPESGAYFGIWRGPGPGRTVDGQNNLDSLQALEHDLGRTFVIDHRYYDWGTELPTMFDRWTAKNGRVPMVSVCSCHFAGPSNVPWGDIAKGTYDDYIGRVADGFKALDRPAFFSFEGEPESQVGARGSAADYVGAFRRVVTIFRERRADNVSFMWVTTAYAFRPESHQTATVKALYPGDDVVDWVASNPYNFFIQSDWSSLSDEMDAWYRWARAEHPDKPLALTEWGSKEDAARPGRKGDWLRDALGLLETRYRQVKAVVYFDEEKHERGIVNDWRIDTSQTSLAAFGELARAQWFAVTPAASRLVK